MLRVLSIFPTSNAYFSHAHVQDWRGLQACAAVIWEELHPNYLQTPVGQVSDSVHHVFVAFQCGLRGRRCRERKQLRDECSLLIARCVTVMPGHPLHEQRAALGGTDFADHDRTRCVG